MWTGVSVKTKPTLEAITLIDQKDYMNVDFPDDDTKITKLIVGAIGQVDGPGGIGYALMTQTWRKTYDKFPAIIVLPGAPVKSIVSIKYVDTDGAEQTIDPADYRVDLTSEPVRVVPVFSGFWPTARFVIAAISIEYTLGEDDADDVDQVLITAVKQIVAYQYEMREAAAPKQQSAIMFGAEKTLREYSRVRAA